MSPAQRGIVVVGVLLGGVLLIAAAALDGDASMAGRLGLCSAAVFFIAALLALCFYGADE